MKLLKIFLAVITIISISSCSTVNEPDIIIKNNMILHNGFKLNVTNFQHDFLLNVKVNDDYDISRISYKLMIPNNDDLWGTFIPKQRIILRENQDFKELQILSDETSYFDLCSQMNAMFKSSNDVFSMKMDLEFITSDNKKISVKNIEVKIKSSTMWDKIRNFVVENGCGVTNLPSFIILIKSLIGG